VDKTNSRHDIVMKLLVKRYVTTEQQRREEEFGITEDDVMEIRQDISTMRFELVDILRKNGMKTPDVAQDSRELFHFSPDFISSSKNITSTPVKSSLKFFFN